MTQAIDLLNRLVSGQGYSCVRKDELGLAAGHHYLKRLFEHFSFDFVFDVGANNGQYARLLRKEIGFGGHILSVEPIPDIVRKLTEKSRHDPHWSIHEAALDSTPGSADFNIMVGHEFSSLMAPSGQFDGKFHGQQKIKETIRVKVETLDDLFRSQEAAFEFRKPFIKLDTQGTELRVLDAAGYALERIPAIQLEVSFQVIYEGAPDISESIRFMADHGFSLSGLFANNRGHFPRLIEMDAVFIKSSLLGELS
jgi:FkbM family methyltransferase